MIGVTLDRGFEVPLLGFGSQELAEDLTYTRRISEREVQSGDILGFGRFGDDDPRRIHLGVARVNGSIEVVHNSRQIGWAEVRPLGELLEQERYARLMFVRRPMRRSLDKYNPRVAVILGGGQ